MNRRACYRWLLTQPEWRAKRREIITSRGSHCQHCGTIHGLEVHHRLYQRGRRPWEYPNHNFIVLCGDCHLRVTIKYRKARRLRQRRRKHLRRASKL